MTQSFYLQVLDDGLGTLTFDMPDRKVNIFTREVLAELQGLVQELETKTEIRCLVLLSGKADNFIAGANVDDIEAVTDPLEVEAAVRQVHRIFETWENLPFPTVAAVRGTCVGGGGELALACDYIVSSDRDNIRIGWPEVKLGILPGWGGCTRLPPRVGVTAALDLILTGRLIPPRKAFKIGLADALLPDASFSHLVRDFARSKMEANGRKPRSQDLKTVLLEGNPIGRKLVFDQARKQVMKTTRGHYPAPLRALEVVKIGVEKGRAQAFEAEARAEGELATSTTSKNLVHVFRMMEGAKKDPDNAPQPLPINRAAVLGAGVMGGGIGQLLAFKRDIPVRMKDLEVGALAGGMKHAAALFQAQVKRHRLTRPEAKRKMNLIRPTLDYSGFSGADLVIEAIVEVLEIKQKVFAEVAAQVSGDTILATNTSSLSIDLIAQDTPNPERVIGMHFFNPVHKMPLVEVVVGELTSPRVTQTIVDFSRQLGKTPVVVKNGPGFLVNRLLAFYSVGILWLLDEGYRMEALDQTFVDWGMPMGPIALTDEVGIDVANKVAHILQQAYPDRIELPDWVDRMAADPTRLGKKTGKGLYTYSKGKRERPDDEVYEILGIPGDRAVDDPTRVVERAVLPMVNEAARCLDEGIVDSPADVDLAMIMGTGFPPFRGGLCRWADSQGLDRLVDELDEFADSVGKRYTASDALRRYASRGGFYAD